MARKGTKAAKKKQAAKKAGSEKTTTAEDEKAKERAITQWLRTLD